MTGKALEYFKALARCCPPQPDDADGCSKSRTLEYSIKHCRNRIMLGIEMIKGMMYCPPQFRSGLSVEETPVERNMQTEMKRSPSTLAYEVRASARSISPNFPSWTSAMRPILMRFKVERNQYRPVRESLWKGMIKKTTSKKR